MKKTHSSLEFSKWLKKMKLSPSNPNRVVHVFFDELKEKEVFGNLGDVVEYVGRLKLIKKVKDINDIDYYVSHDILNDLMVKYRNEIWGNTDIGEDMLNKSDIVFHYMQRGEKEKAEKFIIEYSILNQK